MTTAANPQSYQNPGWQNSPWGQPWNNQAQSWNNQAWSQPPFWGIGRPIAIAALVFLLAAGHLGRILFWPIGLAALVFMIASGRFGCGRRRWGGGNWGQQNQAGNGQNPNNQGGGWQSCIPPWANWGANWGGGGNREKPPTSGNHAFDEYRAETLRRLEEEQSEFSSFLERLRFAKDKSEFDQFMAERRQAPRPPTVPDEPAHG
jgi:Protein of unknown function (DUF2852)